MHNIAYSPFKFSVHVEGILMSPIRPTPHAIPFLAFYSHYRQFKIDQISL